LGGASSASHAELTPPYRYEIEGDAPGWEDAERHVASATKHGKVNPVVAVKSGKAKRKGGSTAAEVYDKEIGEKERKKLKRMHKKA